MSKTIAWSKNGFIAYAMQEHSHNLAVTHMETVDGHRWRLACPRKFLIRPPVYGDMLISENVGYRKTADAGSSNAGKTLLPVTHVEWSTVGDYLACLDAHGNMTIFGGGIRKELAAQYIYSPFNEFVTLYNDTVVDAPVEHKKTVSYKLNSLPGTCFAADSADCTTRVVAFEWLHVHKPTYGMMPAVRVGTEDGKHKFSYSFNHQKLLGFSHPVASKQACIGVRKNGELCFWYQGSHGLNFNRVTTHLDEGCMDAGAGAGASTSTSTSTDADADACDMYVSHASFGFRKGGTLLLATYSPFSRLLKFYSIVVDWGLFGKDDKVGSTSTPKLLVQRVAQEYVPAFGTQGLPQELTHVKVISSNFTSDAEQNIFLVFRESSSCKAASSVFRYQLSEVSLQPSCIFVKKSAKKVNSAAQRIKLQEILKFSDAVINMETVSRNLFVYFVLNNGEIEIRQANNLRKRCGAADATQLPAVVMTLYDAGFNLQRLQGPVQFAAVSPNLAAVAYMNNNSQRIRLCLAETNSRDKVAMTDLERLTVSAAFAVAHSESCFGSLCCDDLIAAMQVEVARQDALSQQAGARLTEGVMREAHSALKFSLVYNTDQLDKLLGNPPLQKLLSLQMTLGTGVRWERTKPGKTAWIILNLRACAFGIMISLKAWYRDLQRGAAGTRREGKMSQAACDSKAGLLAGALGVAQWVLDFAVYLCQDLLNITILSSGQQAKFKEAFDASLALPIIMAKVPRVILINSLKGLKQLVTFASRYIDEQHLSHDSRVFHAARRMKHMLSGLVVDVGLFEQFLGKVEVTVKASLGSNNGNGADKQLQLSLVAIEQLLVCQGKIPDELLNASKFVLKLFNETLRKETNCSQLYFCSLDWLGLYNYSSLLTGGFDTPSVFRPPNYMYDRGERIDYLRKVLMGGCCSLKEKKCVRCGLVASIDDQNVSIGKDHVTSNSWDMAFQRYCFCGASWVSVVE